MSYKIITILSVIGIACPLGLSAETSPARSQEKENSWERLIEVSGEKIDEVKKQMRNFLYEDSNLEDESVEEESTDLEKDRKDFNRDHRTLHNEKELRRPSIQINKPLSQNDLQDRNVFERTVDDIEEGLAIDRMPEADYIDDEEGRYMQSDEQEEIDEMNIEKRELNSHCVGGYCPDE